MTTMRRVALALIRLHPPAWRRRYADEVSALVEDSPATPATIVDLGWSAAMHWFSVQRLDDSISRSEGGLPVRYRILRASVFSLAALAIGVALLPILATVITSVWLVASGRSTEVWPFVAARAQQVIWQAPEVFQVLSFFAVWSLLPALLMAIVLRLAGLAARTPLVARVLTATAFAAVPTWLLPPPAVAIAVMASLVFAWIVVPRRSSVGSAAPTPPASQVHA